MQLPEFIAATGIEKIRASVMEKENAKKLKGKLKERMQPKMGKIDIDYQVRSYWLAINMGEGLGGWDGRGGWQVGMGMGMG